MHERVRGEKSIIIERSSLVRETRQEKLQIQLGQKRLGELEGNYIQITRDKDEGKVRKRERKIQKVRYTEIIRKYVEIQTQN